MKGLDVFKERNENDEEEMKKSKGIKGKGVEGKEMGKRMKDKKEGRTK